jgi:hypothetical protein
LPDGQAANRAIDAMDAYQSFVQLVFDVVVMLREMKRLVEHVNEPTPGQMRRRCYCGKSLCADKYSQ